MASGSNKGSKKVKKAGTGKKQLQKKEHLKEIKKR